MWVPAELLVLTTGYKNQQDSVRAYLGDDIADKIGPVWGFDEGGELRNMWRRTAQSGLWFTAGSLAQCRIFSRYRALQIKALQEGLMTEGAHSRHARPATPHRARHAPMRVRCPPRPLMGPCGDRQRIDSNLRGVGSMNSTPSSPPSRQITRHSRRRLMPSPDTDSVKVGGMSISEYSLAPPSEMFVTVQARGAGHISL
jgi:hypothetical protein